jgi:hypothetical protein
VFRDHSLDAASTSFVDLLLVKLVASCSMDRVNHVLVSTGGRQLEMTFTIYWHLSCLE